MKLRKVAVYTTAALMMSAGAYASQSGSNTSRSTDSVVRTSQVSYGESMKTLRAAAQHLRESIQAAANMEPGGLRDRAIERAHAALWDTQRAMMALPAEARTTSRQASDGNDKGSMRSLDRASERLLDAIDTMSSQDGKDRDRAVRHARQALWDTYEAMTFLPDRKSGKSGERSAAKDSGNQQVAYRDGNRENSRANANGESRDPSQQGQSANPTQANAQTHAQVDLKSQDMNASATRNEGNPIVSGRDGSNIRAADHSGVDFGVIVAPVQVSGDQNLNNGCWARIYENPEFGGSHLTLVGPVNVADLGNTHAGDWNGADSVIVGRDARVTLYDDPDFEDRSATIASGERIADLRDDVIGFFDKVESVQVRCNP